MFDLMTPLAAFSDLGEAFLTVCVGFTFVLVVLLTLTGVTTLIGKLAAKPAAAPKPDPAGPTPTLPSATAANPAPAGEGIDPKVLAAVAAAIRYTVGKRPHRVLAVRASTAGWAQEGRRQIFSSHRLR